MKLFLSGIREKIIFRFFWAFAKLNLFKYFRLSDKKETISSFKLVYFCGKDGVSFLNASLFSVYRNWKALPEVIVITDGTPVLYISNRILKWPRKLDIIEWKICAEYFREKNNISLYNYASNQLWGKKLAAVLYCAEHFPTLYSDSDILWFSSLKDMDKLSSPVLKMGQDVLYCFSNVMLQALGEEKCLSNQPLNAGLIYAHGDFSIHPKWNEICSYLSSKPDHRTEQTTFAILNNFFNHDVYWTFDDVLIKIDDTYSLKNTVKQYPGITARHYVHVKDTTFWRDSIYILLKKSLT